MRSLILTSFFSLFLLVACNSDSNGPVPDNQNKGVTGKLRQPTGENIRPSSGNGIEVESETRVSDPTFNDSGVDYVALANDICACSKESSDLNIEMEQFANNKQAKEFAAMAPKVDKAFQKSVKCSKQVANRLGSEFSPYTLVPQMKNTCPELPADLVGQILKSFGVNL